MPYSQMEIDFLSKLDESNSITNEETGEIILTIEKIETDKTFIIKSPCKIKSNCNTIISCKLFIISSSSVLFENVSFEASISVINSDDFQMKNCTIKKSTCGVSIEIKSSKSVCLHSLTIEETDSSGIIISNNSTVNADNILIHEILKSFIVCNDNSTLYLTNSTFHHSNLEVITISNNSYSEIKNCKISDSIHPAIYSVDSNCHIENNEIENISLNGIVLINAKSFIISNNKLTNIKGSAISVFDDSNGIIHHNLISKVSCNGIYLKKYSNANIYNNDFDEIEYPSIVVLLKSNAKIKENQIKNINSCAIRIINSEKVEIEQNNICDIKECCVSIADKSKCTIKNNEMANCNIAAVEAFNQSDASVTDNHFSKMKEYVFIAFTEGNISAKNNHISDVGKSFVKLIYGGGGDFIDNKIETCPNQKEGQTNSLYYFENNGSFLSVTNDELKAKDTVILEEKYLLQSKKCLKCNRNDRNCYLLSCGHQVYCEDCANDAVQNNGKCPLCRFPILNFSKGFPSEDGLCEICCESKADCLVFPCFHIKFCLSCLSYWLKENKKCPYCQIRPVSIRIIQDI